MALGGKTGSFSLWAYPDPLTGDRAPFGRYWFGYSVFPRNVWGTHWYWLGRWNYNQFSAGQDTVFNQTWQHVAVTYDGSLGSANVKVYVNGVYKASDDETQDVLYENWAWQIGAHGNSAYEWVGDVDEVRLYKETLSADWIEFEYRNMAEADNELTWAAEEEAPDPEESPFSNLIGNPYLFTGRRFDRETELYYYRARYYNPYIGRFLQTDPARQGMNLYNYCGNNPINFLDPSGNWRITRNIPVECVWDWVGENPYNEVFDFLCKSGFFNIHFDPDVLLLEVKVSGGNYECTFGDKHDLDIPVPMDLNIKYIGTVPIVEVNNQFLLDDRTWSRLRSRYPNLRIIDDNECLDYLSTTRSDAEDKSFVQGLWPLTYTNFDTFLPDEGKRYNLYTVASQDWFYIKPMGILAKGHEINYVGQGMLYARMGFHENFNMRLLYGWKIANIIFNDPFEYKLPTPNERFFLFLGYYYYGEPTSIWRYITF